MIPKSWKPKNSKGLIRIGPKYDGGYVIPKIVLDRTKLLIGLGISDNWDFEEDFKKRSGCEVICYDHTVSAKFWRRRFKKDLMAFLLLKRLTPKTLKEMFKYIPYKLFFNGKNAVLHQIMIGYDGPVSTTIDSIIKSLDSREMFFKIDIEGWEYRVIDQLKKHQDKLLGFVIEFHDIDIHKERITRFIEELEKYNIVHIHGNNCGGLADVIGDPLAVEITFLRKDLVESDCIEENSYPIVGLDNPNDIKTDDVKLVFARE